MNEAQVLYDPYWFEPWAAAAYPGELYPQAEAQVEVEAHPGYELHVGAAPFVAVPSQPAPGPSMFGGLGHQLYGLGQEIGQGLEHLFIPSEGMTLSQKADDLHKRAAGAADTMTDSAKEIKKTAAAANVAIAQASSHAEDTAAAARLAAEEARKTAQTIKYVVLGVGALGAAALLVHLVSQVSD